MGEGESKTNKSANRLPPLVVLRQSGKVVVDASRMGSVDGIGRRKTIGGVKRRVAEVVVRPRALVCASVSLSSTSWWCRHRSVRLGCCRRKHDFVDSEITNSIDITHFFF
jgi:hypothetical protein